MAFFVYEITLAADGSVYIGQTKNVAWRVKKHREAKVLAFEHGHTCSVLSTHHTRADARLAEDKAIAQAIADGKIVANVMLGLSHAESTRAKMRAAHAVNSAWAGRCHAAISRKKMATAHAARRAAGIKRVRAPMSVETKAKIAASKKGQVPWNRGVARTDAEKLAISAGQPDMGAVVQKAWVKRRENI